MDNSDTKLNKNATHTHDPCTNTQFIGLPLEYNDISPKSFCSNDFEVDFDNNIFRTSASRDESVFIRNSSITSNSESATHPGHTDNILGHSYFSEKKLNYGQILQQNDQKCASISLEDAMGSMIDIGKGTIFCSNTSLDSTINYSSTLGDSTNILGESFLELHTVTANYSNPSNDNTNWINHNINTLYDYQQRENEGDCGTPQGKNENMRQSLLFLSSWEVEDENIKFKRETPRSSSNLLPYSGNSVKESRITEPTPERSEFTLAQSNLWPIATSNEYKTTVTGEGRDCDMCKSPDAKAMDPNNPATNYKLQIFHKALKPLGAKSESDNLDIGLYFILKQGGIDSNSAKYILLDPQIKMTIHYQKVTSDTDSSNEDLSQANQNFKKWYDLQLSHLYQKYHSNSSTNHTPSVSGLAKFVSAVDWSRKDCVKAALDAQKFWNPFSIFGSAPPSVHLPDIFDYNFYKNFAPLEVLKTNAVFKGLCNMEQINIDNGLNDCDWPLVREYLEKRWNNQVSLDCDWQCDELEISEVFWYLNIMSKHQDQSHSVYTLEPCYCVTPDPQFSRGLMWNDPRCNPIYPRPSLYHPDQLELMNPKSIQELDFGHVNSQSQQQRENSADSIPLDDLPDTPEMIELQNPESCQIDVSLGEVYPLALSQITLCPYRRHPYIDQSYHFPCPQYHSPFGTFTYPSQAVSVAPNTSTPLACATVSAGGGKRRKGLHQYDYQPARVKHKLNFLRKS